MTRNIIVLLFAIITFTHCKVQNNTEAEDIGIKVPTEWIEKLRTLDYTKNNRSLLIEFEKFIGSDTLSDSKAYYKNLGMLNPLFVNLDDDPLDELIGLFGWSDSDMTLAVFKNVNDSWFLIYFEPIYMFYVAPELIVANNFSANKTFYIRQLYHRGSGVYCDAYHFYKIINNKVYPCLSLINKAQIFGWGVFLNQKVEMEFSFNCANADELWVMYDYNFFPGAVYENDVPWEGHEDIPFVKGSNGINYSWDSTTFSYQPQFYNRQDALTEDKIACFGDFGNDTLFIKAFDYEIKQTLEKGTDKQKKILKIYLDFVEKEQKAISSTKE